jgi:hypothetical protein
VQQALVFTGFLFHFDDSCNQQRSKTEAKTRKSPPALAAAGLRGVFSAKSTLPFLAR